MRLIKRTRITVEYIAVRAIGLRSPFANDFGQDLIAYQSPCRHCLFDLSPQRSVGAPHFAQNVTRRDLRVAVFLREQSRLCSLACAWSADYYYNLRHRIYRAYRAYRPYHYYAALRRPSPAQSPAARTKKSIIVAHYELRFNLADRIHCDADHDQ